MIILLLIVVKGIVNCCSSAVSILEVKRTRYTSDKNNPNIAKINTILNNSQKYINATSITNALLGVLIGFILGNNIFDDCILLLNKWFGTTLAFGELLSSAILIFIVAFFFALFSIIVPKALAQRYTDSITIKLKWLMDLLAFIFTPFILIVDLSFRIFSIFVGYDTDTDSFSENEILMIVDASGEQGSIDEHEMEMINNIFDFDDTTAEEIATHRKDILAVPLNISIDNLINIVTCERYSRLPVYENDIDNIIGILHIKDFINAILLKGKDKLVLKDIIREPFFVPSTKKIDSLFKEMQKNKIHMVVVLDEYGGTAGIITMEDLVEEVMGEIQDEYDQEEQPEITEVSDDITIIEGSTDLEDVAEKLNIKMPINEYDTLAGFLIGMLDRIPDDNEKDIIIDYKNYMFSIDEIDNKRIVKVTATKKAQEIN